VILGMMASQVQAFGHRNGGCYSDCGYSDCCAPVCSPCVTYVERVVTCYRPEWREEKVKVTVNRMYCRAEVVPVKCTYMVPVFKDVKQTYTYLVPVPRIVEQEVMRCRYVPVECCDPCTGCVSTCYRPEMFAERVKCTVYECKEEKKDVMVRVCHYVP